ncbi:MAG: aminoglycoside phosphotransferase family protein [Clostridia bacterium]|nr:aminoglycoside phosphotransferase family protein [Clostridia bacterium]
MTIQEICSFFDIGGKYVGCKELSTGIINSTYHVEYIRDGERKDYIVQKINKTVFKNPKKLMDNIVRVTEYIRGNVILNELSTKRFVLRAFVTKKDRKPYWKDDTGEYWRVYRYIKNSITYDATDNLRIIQRVGQAFGRFQDFLDGFNAKTLYVTIPDFHNTPKRYKAFRAAIKKDPKKRVKWVAKEIEDLNFYEERASLLQRYLDEGRLPLRVTHNDTKCNNVTFDKDTDEALAVLDLDTVMPGAVAYDFGDAIRFIANNALEDDPDTEKVSLNLKKYEAFTKGFITELKEDLTSFEKKTMNLGVFTMTVELAVRFLTDYINGDKYFKTKYPGHNLDRARNQIALAKDILRKTDDIDKILAKYI